VVQLGLEGFQPLPMVQLTGQLAFMPQGLAGGMAQAMILSPVGPLICSANLMGQLSAEMIAGAQFTDTSQLMVGVHGWGMPGTIGGFKAAAELQHFNVEGESLIEASTITLSVTAPRFVDNKPTATPPSWSLSAFKRMGPDHSIFAHFDAPSNGGCVLSAGGTRKIDESTRLRGKFNTTGVLALALEMSGHKDVPIVGDKANLTLTSEVSSVGPLNPKVGATLQLSS